ncbi:hypothetical protein [Kineococcus aurantiacus]|uniref:Uncharacterized protein n=1 Tax=Kineococcus aurantiacus TaxID=37633 RepID=A0A7Y9J346_9ACTN|nr:hypothetical protein [Kineococcus aurantiacus]NYD24921.1 hypothetical protein [Kineococcus aurantiacus]
MRRAEVVAAHFDTPAATWNGSLDSSAVLAPSSRELVADDPQGNARPDSSIDGPRGGVADRNVELLLPEPVGVAQGVPCDPTAGPRDGRLETPVLQRLTPRCARVPRQR